MGVRILEAKTGEAVIYCSTSAWAFGPIFHDSDDGEVAAADRALAFLRWLPRDARLYKDNELERKYCEWLAVERVQG